MRHVSVLLAAVLLAPAFVPASTVQSRPPNIVWIVAENANLEFGAYGEKLVATPNVDRLAAEGVRFTRVFSTAPVCAPSRSYCPMSGQPCPLFLES